MPKTDYGWREVGQTVGCIVLTYGTLWAIYAYHTLLPSWVGGVAAALIGLPFFAFGALIVLSGALAVTKAAGGDNLP